MPEKKLEEFEMNHPKDVHRCLTEAIKHWINDGEVKWEVLWEALCDSSVSHGDLGRKIKNWYQAKTWRDPRARPVKIMMIDCACRYIHNCYS